MTPKGVLKTPHLRCRRGVSLLRFEDRAVVEGRVLRTVFAGHEADSSVGVVYAAPLVADLRAARANIM